MRCVNCIAGNESPVSTAVIAGVVVAFVVVVLIVVVVVVVVVLRRRRRPSNRFDRCSQTYLLYVMHFRLISV